MALNSLFCADVPLSNYSPHVKVVFGRKKSKIGPKNGGFSEI